ncbi:MAG: ABC transporter ATP-binding protein [Lachnospiraceae bacterium]|nr:ABC transporter ATP-binding protein [Lachnospiraceae bacterium]
MFKGIVFFIKNGWRYDKRYILWRVLYQFINSLIPIVATIMPKLIIDELMGNQETGKLIAYVSTLIIYTAAATIFSEYFSWDGFSRRCKVNSEFDSDLHKHLAEADFEKLEDPNFLDMQKKASKFLYCDWHGFGYLLDCSLDALGQIFTLIGIAAIIATTDFRILILFIVLIILGAFIEKRAKQNAIRLSEGIIKEQRGWTYYAGLFEDHSFAKEIRLNSLGKWLLVRERNYFTKVNENRKKQNDGFIISGFFGAIFTLVQQSAAYAYLIYCVVSGVISIGSFTMYTGAVTTFSIAFRKVLDSLIEIQAYDTYYDKLGEYLNLPKTLREGKELLDADRPHFIEFRNVSFKYSGSDTYALKDVNITIPFGQKLSIVGENGAGKTTFVKLMTRMYDPTEGEILLDGVNIKKIDYEQYMSFFASVFQDYKLFSFSIKDNVALAQPMDEDKVRDILEYVGFCEKLRKLQNGIDTSVFKNFDEEGFEPSGGEGQKLALARALYKDAPIVLLDEPTAAMDPKAEYELYQRFNEMVQGKTAVYISHRLSSAKFCDVIAVFCNGQIIEYGSHDELYSKGGLYAELFSMQSQFYC